MSLLKESGGGKAGKRTFNMGTLESLQGQDNSAERLFNTYQNMNGEPFIDTLTEEYMDNDNLVVLQKICNWAATTLIPRYADINL